MGEDRMEAFDLDAEPWAEAPRAAEPPSIDSFELSDEIASPAAAEPDDCLADATPVAADASRQPMRFTVEEHNRSYRAGFAYMPKQDPKRLGSRRVYRYLGDGWFAWREEG